MIKSVMHKVIFVFATFFYISCFAAEPVVNTWIQGGRLNAHRAYHTTTLLANGSVLVAGDSSNRTSEIYNTETNTWVRVANMNVIRHRHTATLLPNGTVFVTGGVSLYCNCGINSAEIYNPETNTWTKVADMRVGRYGHTATLLPNGAVLVTGGYNDGNLASAEIYDPSTNSWAMVASMNIARHYQTATLLNNGSVFVTGGWVEGGACKTSSAEIYDPSANIWTRIANMNVARRSSSAVLLSDHKVLVIGGEGGAHSDEIYDLLSGGWSKIENIIDSHQERHGDSVTGIEDQHSALLLGESVLIAGGSGNNAELCNYNTCVCTVTKMNTPRSWFGDAILLSNGLVLVAGGVTAHGSTELFITQSALENLNKENAQYTEQLEKSSDCIISDNDKSNRSKAYLERGKRYAMIKKFKLAQDDFEALLLQNNSWTEANKSLIYFEYGRVFLLDKNEIKALSSFTLALDQRDEWINKNREMVSSTREQVFNELNPKPPLCSCLDYNDNPSPEEKVYGYQDACHKHCCKDKANVGKYHAAKLGQINKECN